MRVLQLFADFHVRVSAGDRRPFGRFYGDVLIFVKLHQDLMIAVWIPTEPPPEGFHLGAGNSSPHSPYIAVML